MKNSKIEIHNFLIGTLAGSIIVLVFAFGFITLADIASDFCPGNVCASQEISFKADTSSDKCGGPNTLQYFYTQHARPGEKFKVQFLNKNPMSTDCALLFAVTDFENFDKTIGKWKYGHYDGSGPSDFGTETTTPFTFKVESTKGFSGSLDFVMWLTIPETTPAGVYNFKIGATEYNQNYTSGTLKLYVDSSAPSNNNEGDEFTGKSDWLPCADGVDNDLSYRYDCADIKCLGKVGKKDCAVAGQCMCEAKETTCFDRFDNDFDKDGIQGGFDAGGDYDPETGADCRDLDCDKQQGDANDALKKCYFKNEFGGFPSSCEDYFNNDADQGTAEAVNAFANLAEAYLGKNNTWRDCLDDDCWRKGGPCPAKETVCDNGIDDDYDDGLNTKDEWPLTGADCNDYDCGYLELGDGSPCSKKENLDKEGQSAPAQCFDGLDNDLDAYYLSGDKYMAKNPLPIDCGDPDCKGAQNPESPFNVCSDNEFVVGSYQYCANPKGYLKNLQGGIDDDGDQLTNCEDDIGVGQKDDCKQKFGNCGPCPDKEFWKYDACADGLNNDFDTTTDCGDADCANKIGRLSGITYCGGENSDAACGDNFDNDGNSKTDCADATCNNKNQCEFKTEKSCSDGFDNDADGKIDCADADCAGNSSCISLVSCLGILPSWDPAVPGQLFATGGFLKGAQTNKMHLADTHQIIIQGNATYNSLTITIGNAVKPIQYFPYNSKLCTFDNDKTTTDQLVMVADTAGRILQVTNKPQQTVASPVIKIKCPADSILSKDDEYTYPVAVDATRLNEEYESGELFFTTKVITDITAPEVKQMQVIGLDSQINTVKVPYGGSIFVQTVPTDNSKICKCEFLLNQTNQTAISGCQAEILDLKQDVASFTVQARAEDGAGNQSGYGPVKSFDLNVIPIAVSAPELTKKNLKVISPFYESTDTVGFEKAKFQGVQEDSFTACKILVDGAEIGTGTAIIDSSGSCHGSFAANFASGEHKLALEATDSDNDSVQSPTKVFYVCNAGDDKSPCDMADFDQDGVPEGTQEDTYGPWLSCDNCIGLENPDQEDADGDGIGDDCEQEKKCEENPVVVCEKNDQGQYVPPTGYDEECSECCLTGWCSNDKTISCCDDSKCGGNGKCEKDIKPWLQTSWGDIYAGKSVNLNIPPATDKYNATFCILTSGKVVKFSSGLCQKDFEDISELKLSKSSKAVNLYAKNVLSSINLKKLEQSATKLSSGETIPSILDGEVYVIEGDTEIKQAIEFMNGQGDSLGAGLIIVKGNLTIKNDLKYEASLPGKIENLASVGFIVIGNITIDPGVTNLVGAFFAGGEIHTGAGDKPLQVAGLIVGHQFVFERKYAEEDGGAEQIIYDGRAAANPPPGMGDFVKTLPAFKEVVP